MSAAAFEHASALARAADRDRWIAALFAPAPDRKHLHTLTAFAHEIARVRHAAREPLAGEMRLMWWLEAILGQRDEAQANPLAAALLATIAERALPKPRFEAWLIAWRDDLYRPILDPAARGRELWGPLFALSARALGGEADAAALEAGAAETLIYQRQYAQALAEIAAAEASLTRAAGPIGPAFATLGAMKLDARRGSSGKPPAAPWRRQIAIWQWG